MYEALIITPVKNSIETTISTIQSIKNAKGNFLYTVYNDFSTEANTYRLKEICSTHNITLVNLGDFTLLPSPNYRLVLQMAQQKALEYNVPLIIIESDVTIYSNTIADLLDLALTHDNLGLLGCVTHDENGKINFPYRKLRKCTVPVLNTRHSISFCCTLISIDFLKTFDFGNLNSNKHWFDVSISKKSLRLGFKNYITTQNSVLHTPHSSRPWKLMKYKNPVKYYFIKVFKRLDKI